jgi:hypothetical protein
MLGSAPVFPCDSEQQTLVRHDSHPAHPGDSNRSYVGRRRDGSR